MNGREDPDWEPELPNSGLCPLLWLENNINARLLTKAALGILEMKEGKWRMSRISQGRLQGELNEMPRDRPSLSGRLVEGQMFWAGDSMSSDSMVKMNWNGLWGQGAAGAVTQTGALWEGDESSGWRHGWSQLAKGLEYHAGNLSFLCRHLKDTVQAETQPSVSRAGGCDWAEYRDRWRWGSSVGCSGPCHTLPTLHHRGWRKRNGYNSKNLAPEFPVNGLCTRHCAVQFAHSILYYPDSHTVK